MLCADNPIWKVITRNQIGESNSVVYSHDFDAPERGAQNQSGYQKPGGGFFVCRRGKATRNGIVQAAEIRMTVFAPPSFRSRVLLPTPKAVPISGG